MGGKGGKRPGKKARKARSTGRLLKLGSAMVVIPSEMKSYFHEGGQGKILSRKFYERLSLGLPVPLEKHGIQTAPTPMIRAFADNYPKDLEGIKRMVRDIGGVALKGELAREGEKISTLTFKLIKTKPSFAEWIYGKRTADDIIATKKIACPFAGRLPVWGCSDQATALVAALRAKGVEVKHIRTVYGWWDKNAASFNRPHSIVWFKLGNRQYLADPFLRTQNEDRPLVEQVGERLSAQIKHLEKENKWHPSKDLWSFGIRNVFDYYKGIDPDNHARDQKTFREYLLSIKDKIEKKTLIRKLATRFDYSTLE